jgi:hypothetical protein
MESYEFSLNLQRKLSGEDVKELLCFLMVVSLLGSSRWHPLFYNAQILRAKEMPAITNLSP